MSGLAQRNFRVVDEHYALIPKTNVPRSTFRQVHEHKTTAPSGYLIPLLVQEVLPGDVHSGKVTIFARLSTLLFPLMDNATVETQFFFVPARILWDNWKRFMGEQTNPGDSISYTIPLVSITGNAGGFSATDLTLMLFDYMGIPVANFVGVAKPVNSLPFRAYNLIWNEWYRDQNLQNSATVTKTDTGDLSSHFGLLRRNKKHDYFTSALPSPQRGAAVTLPLGTSAPVRGIGKINQAYGLTSQIVFEAGQAGSTTLPFAEMIGTALGGTATNTGYAIAGTAATGGFPNIYADLSAASAATINTLRLATQTQKLLELDARGGTRYTESLKNHWGVNPQDSRLQRPEYIGGGSSNIQTAAIAQTSGSGLTGQTTPFGGLAGQAVATGMHSYTCAAQEHGYILGLMSLMTRQTYQEGVHRMWTRQTRYELAWPEFSGIGEQIVRNDEIYAQGTAADGNAFGYQERFAEYRFMVSRVSGMFRTKNTGAIGQWHLAQQNNSLPTLGSTWIAENMPFSRVLAAGATADNQQYIVDALFDARVTRALPAYGVPGSLTGTF